jgi:hypothetical protein
MMIRIERLVETPTTPLDYPRSFVFTSELEFRFRRRVLWLVTRWSFVFSELVLTCEL